MLRATYWYQEKPILIDFVSACLPQTVPPPTPLVFFFFAGQSSATGHLRSHFKHRFVS